MRGALATSVIARPAALAAVALAASWIGLAALVALQGNAALTLVAGRGAQQSPAPALAEIPPSYLALYLSAGTRYGVDWAVLAAIGKVECDHGRDPDPSCGREGAVNAAGAGGPMQFLGTTWSRFGVDGDGDGRRDRWDAADAIYGAANYLRASGAPRDYRAAIFAYNRASWYVATVLRWADRYRSDGGGAGEGDGPSTAAYMLQSRTQTDVRTIAGSVARLDPGDGHLALIPTDAPPAVQAMLIAGNELQSLPYGPDGHPNPLGSPDEDCSSTVSYLLYRAGVRPLQEIVRENPLAQNYVGWGLPGPGRWVTIYATASPAPHVFAVIAGLRIDTSHNGTDVGPNRDQDGPRWRLLGGIPTWAHWSVRHPPGL